MTNTGLSLHQLRMIFMGRLLAALLLLMAMFFLPAGTILYWEVWVFMVVLFIPMSVFAAYFLLRAIAKG